MVRYLTTHILRTSIKNDSDYTPADMVYGSKIRIPGEFFNKQSIDITENEFLKELRRAIIAMKPAPIQHKDKTSIFVHPDLQSTKYCFVRCDKVKTPLQSPYDGPYEVLERQPKFFKLMINNSTKNIFIDRLKPDYVLDKNIEDESKI